MLLSKGWKYIYMITVELKKCGFKQLLGWIICEPGLVLYNSSMKVLVLAHWVPGAGAKILSKQISFLSKQSSFFIQAKLGFTNAPILTILINH